MKLFVDAGNTRIKWQLRHEDQVLASGAGQIESESLFQGGEPSFWQQVSTVSVCTVRSEEARHELEQVIAARTSAPVRFLWAQPRFGELVCAYSDPALMGADRWFAMVAAWHRVGGACLVIDAGSAITIDWINHRGEHEGGYILPGKRLMLESLTRKTARVLFDAEDQRSALAPGRSTSECVFHGVNWLTLALARQLGQEAGAPVIVTGGDGMVIKQALEEAASPAVGVVFCPDLVLDGLSLAEGSLCAG